VRCRVVWDTINTHFTSICTLLREIYNRTAPSVHSFVLHPVPYCCAVFILQLEFIIIIVVISETFLCIAIPLAHFSTLVLIFYPRLSPCLMHLWIPKFLFYVSFLDSSIRFLCRSGSSLSKLLLRHSNCTGLTSASSKTVQC
jgi:hypothetical protein